MNTKETAPLHRKWPENKAHMIIERGTLGGWAVHDLTREYSREYAVVETAYFSDRDHLIAYLAESLPIADRANREAQ